MHPRLLSSTGRFAVVLALSLGTTAALSLSTPRVAAAAAGTSKLAPGEKLTAGQSIKSPNGKYTLFMQTDGNFVLYGPAGATWAAGTQGAGNYAAMQADGNLVVYSSQGAPKWYSGTWEQPGASLSLQDDGNLVLYKSGAAVWHTNTYVRDTRLDPGEQLTAGKSIVSADDRYALIMQADGNLVLYGPTGAALWNSKTAGTGHHAVMQADGNLVVYDANNVARWNSGTFNKPGAHLQLQPDGNLVIYKDNQALWNSGTWERATTLRVGESLRADQTRFSPDGKFKLVMQSDGNLVLYGPSGAVWSTSTQGQGHTVIMQADGHLVMYDAANQPKWWSNTAGHPGALLQVRDGGTLAIVSGNQTLWTNVAPAGPAGPASGNIVTANGPNGCAIRVDASIKPKVEALLNAAHAAGKPMCGWGWRSPESQIALRRSHCGTSNYAVYEMPANQCHPPTARPGSSQHEIGLAIDFFNGTLQNHTDFGGAQLTWMRANAATFGLQNLPSEPWHWSTTGH